MGLSETLKAVSDPNRRAILEMLRDGMLPAGEIAQRLGLSPSTTSHHLATLRKAGLVEEHRHGTYVDYELCITVFEDVLAWVMSLKGEEND